jgi:hypothetical protein
MPVTLKISQKLLANFISSHIVGKFSMRDAGQ